MLQRKDLNGGKVIEGDLTTLVAGMDAVMIKVTPTDDRDDHRDDAIGSSSSSGGGGGGSSSGGSGGGSSSGGSDSDSSGGGGGGGGSGGSSSGSSSGSGGSTTSAGYAYLPAAGGIAGEAAQAADNKCDPSACGVCAECCYSYVAAGAMCDECVRQRCGSTATSGRSSL